MSIPGLPYQMDATFCNTPIPYTTSPLRLMWSDVRLFFQFIFFLPGIVFPWKPWGDGKLDELYPSMGNMTDILFHTVLFVLQLVFIFSLPLLTVIPAWAFVFYMTGILVLNWLICKPLNGSQPFLESRVDLSKYPRHEHEKWVFINGVAAGHYWLQANIDRIALTFGRPVLGIHNPTSGIVFDVLQCLIQRDFRYDTEDIRTQYAVLKTMLQDAQYTKVVVVLHSQGGIEGGMCIDWLLADLPESATAKLEVYTFGNAANHFNSPLRSLGETANGKFSPAVTNRSTRNGSAFKDAPTATPQPSEPRVIAHIEHYANAGDFVSRWGVLHFAAVENRFVGRVFVREGSGHMFNQHYLANMFQMRQGRVGNGNAFMDGVYRGVDGEDRKGRAAKEVSRLWAYRDGRSPSV